MENRDTLAFPEGTIELSSAEKEAARERAAAAAKAELLNREAIDEPAEQPAAHTVSAATWNIVGAAVNDELDREPEDAGLVAQAAFDVVTKKRKQKRKEKKLVPLRPPRLTRIPAPENVPWWNKTRARARDAAALRLWWPDADAAPFHGDVNEVLAAIAEPVTPGLDFSTTDPGGRGYRSTPGSRAATPAATRRSMVHSKSQPALHKPSTAPTQALTAFDYDRSTPKKKAGAPRSPGKEGPVTCGEVFLETAKWPKARRPSVDWPLPRVIRRVARHRVALARAMQTMPDAPARDQLPFLGWTAHHPGPDDYVCP